MTTQCHKIWQRRLPCGRQRGQLPRRQVGSQVIGIRFGRAVSPQTQRASVERAECRGHGCADRPADQPDLGCVPAFPPAPKDRLIAIFSECTPDCSPGLSGLEGAFVTCYDITAYVNHRTSHGG